ncbi:MULTISPECIES: hypothetical protein [Kitasatospora]|uniref:Uncharacterized protein n=1 Tax=Kitasatospora cathayae TaxID=3004092 RepID=A0ABY7Q783_9ACTN|nr:hypothetical protein [Kitasatospora sp. HUAS 3-15]WBP88523.1 hypothetical protein O1G21_23545 [Kitasatospora sp. HUAS 3-15]
MPPTRHAAARSPTVDRARPAAPAATCEVVVGPAAPAGKTITVRVG